MNVIDWVKRVRWQFGLLRVTSSLRMNLMCKTRDHIAVDTDIVQCVYRLDLVGCRSLSCSCCIGTESYFEHTPITALLVLLSSWNLEFSLPSRLLLLLPPKPSRLSRLHRRPRVPSFKLRLATPVLPLKMSLVNGDARCVVSLRCAESFFDRVVWNCITMLLCFVFEEWKGIAWTKCCLRITTVMVCIGWNQSNEQVSLINSFWIFFCFVFVFFRIRVTMK